MKSLRVLAPILLFACPLLIPQTAPAPARSWFKGNLHTHTLNSDGDSTPDDVVKWYRERNYHFLVLTDHNYVTEIAGLNALHGAAGKFLLITGEELSDQFQKKPIHLNAFNPSRLVTPQHGDSVASTIQHNVDEIRKANGVPALNHPNFGWAVTVEDLLAIRGLGLFEVYNGHPMVNNQGGGGFRSLDEMWDALLTAGQKFYGVAVDDAHEFKRFGGQYSNPGHGWVEVRAETLSAGAILSALERGDFYASTGLKLRDVATGGKEYRVEVQNADWEKVTTYFIGEGGTVLARSFEPAAVYRYKGTEKYVRVRVESSSGARAWTQPVFSPGR
jgi:hypothetical protein